MKEKNCCFKNFCKTWLLFLVLLIILFACSAHVHSFLEIRIDSRNPQNIKEFMKHFQSRRSSFYLKKRGPCFNKEKCSSKKLNSQTCRSDLFKTRLSLLINGNLNTKMAKYRSSEESERKECEIAVTRLRHAERVFSRVYSGLRSFTFVAINLPERRNFPVRSVPSLYTLKLNSEHILFLKG